MACGASGAVEEDVLALGGVPRRGGARFFRRLLERAHEKQNLPDVVLFQPQARHVGAGHALFDEIEHLGVGIRAPVDLARQPRAAPGLPFHAVAHAAIDAVQPFADGKVFGGAERIGFVRSGRRRRAQNRRRGGER